MILKTLMTLFLINLGFFAQQPGQTMRLALPDHVVLQLRFIPGFEADKQQPETLNPETIRIAGFWMTQAEINLAQWQAIMGGPAIGRTEALLPINDISLNEIQEYIARLNQTFAGFVFRLPTAREWQYACRSGLEPSQVPMEALDPKDAIFSSSDRTAARRIGPQPGGETRANAWGLVDMRGNVAEWVTFAGSSNGMGQIRGGSYQSNSQQCDCDQLVWTPLSMVDPSIGFRLVVVSKGPGD